MLDLNVSGYLNVPVLARMHVNVPGCTKFRSHNVPGCMLMYQDDLNLGLRSTGISKIFENPRSKILDITVRVPVLCNYTIPL